MDRSILVVIAAFAVCGCAQQGAEQAAPAQAALPAKLTMSGPKGKLSLGDSLDRAKNAFPAPPDAQVSDTSMAFAIAGGQGWAWQTADGALAFEVLLRNNKVAAVAVTRTGDPTASIRSAEREWGKPTHKASGSLAMAESWVSGESACMAVTSSAPAMGRMGFLLMGSKSDLRLLNYDPDDPGAFVKLMDGSTAMAKELEPVFKEAKRKAMEQATKKREGTP